MFCINLPNILAYFFEIIFSCSYILLIFNGARFVKIHCTYGRVLLNRTATPESGRSDFPFLLQYLAVTAPAQRLVFLLFTQQHPLVVGNGTVGDVRQVTAFHTDGMHLRHFVGDGTQGRYRSERHTFKVHVQSGNDDSHPAVGQFVAHVYQPFVEELGLVYAHHVYFRTEQQDACRRVYRSRGDGIIVVRHHFLFRIACVDGRLEYLHSLTGEGGAFQAADQFFGLARKHGTADDFYSSSAAGFMSMIF
jgi:hypothetical protein